MTTTHELTITVDPERLSLRQMRALEKARTVDETVAAIADITGLSVERALDIGPSDLRRLKQAIKVAWDSAANDPN